MKTSPPFLRSAFVQLSALTLLALQAPAQLENPIQGSHTSVSGGPPVGTTCAEIVPLFWKALIGGAIVSVPLSSVESFGVQTYDVDGVSRVRELTITTKSRSMIRIPVSSFPTRIDVSSYHSAGFHAAIHDNHRSP
jgi:hypothetical protein